MALPPIMGNARNNYLYGTGGNDGIDGGAGDDYLRGYQGDDSLWGGTGADRFVFERTWAQNGTDTIMDYSFSQGDILDFSLVGFARGVFNRAAQLSDVIRIKQGPGNTARLLIDLDGGGNSFQEWAVLQNMALGASVSLRVGASVFDAVVAKHPPVVTSFTVSGANQLSITADDAVTAQLRAWNGVGPGTVLFTSTPNPLVAYQPGTFTLTAQAIVTEAVLRITDGVDTVAPTPDTHVFLGTDGNDQGGTAITGSANADMIFGFGGNDLIMAGAGADTIYGGTGNDTIDGDGGADVIDGEAGNDVMWFTSAADLAGAATIIGGADVDTITLLPGGSALALVSANFAKATGFEALDLQGDSTLAVTLGTETNAAFASGITITSRATATSLNLQGAASTVGINATGTNNADTLVGGAVADTLAGGTGNDTITGGAGADSLSGGDGDDVFVIGNASDINGLAETIDGGTHTTGDTIRVDVTAANISAATVSNIEFLQSNFAGATTLTVASNQLGSGKIGEVISADTAGADVLATNDAILDVRGVTLTNIDTLRANGVGQNVVFVSNSQLVAAKGAAGVSTVETLATGGDVDVLQSADAMLDLTGMTLTNIDYVLNANGGDTTIIMDADDLGAGKVSFVLLTSPAGAGVLATKDGTLDVSGVALTNIDTLTVDADGNTDSAQTITVAANQVGTVVSGKVSTITSGNAGQTVTLTTAGALFDLTGVTLTNIDTVQTSAIGATTITMDAADLAGPVTRVASADADGDDVLRTADAALNVAGVTLGNIDTLQSTFAGNSTITVGNAQLRGAGVTAVTAAADPVDNDALQTNDGLLDVTGVTLTHIETLSVDVDNNNVNDIITVDADALAGVTHFTASNSGDTNVLVTNTAANLNVSAKTLTNIHELRALGAGNNVITVANSQLVATAGAAGVSTVATEATGTDTLRSADSSLNLTGMTLTNIDQVQSTFTGASTITMAGTQLSNGGGSVTVVSAEASGTDILQMAVAGVFDLTNVTLTNIDLIQGTVAADTIAWNESAGAISINGGGGDDLIDHNGVGTSSLADTIFGGSGNDTIFGGDGNDVITGGDGIDELNGEVGADLFSLTGVNAAADRDVVNDFTVGQDRVGLDVDFTGALTVSDAQAAFATHTFSSVNVGNSATDYNVGLANAAFDVIEFIALDDTRGNLGAATDGSELLKLFYTNAVGGNPSGSLQFTDAAAVNTYLLAYDNNNAYIYLANSGDRWVQAGEIALVGVVNGVVAGGLSNTDFVMVL